MGTIGPYFLLLPFLRVGGTITISTLHRGWEAPAGIGSDDSKSLSDSIRNMPATKVLSKARPHYYYWKAGKDS